MENINLNRRSLIASITTGAIISSSSMPFAFAQEATPADSMDHGMEPLIPARAAGEVQWTISDAGLSIPAEIQAGLSHVTVTNTGSLPTHIVTFSVPEGVSDDVVLTFGGDDDSPPPEWFASQHFPGCPNYVQPGQELNGYVTYHAGRYFAMDLMSGSHAFFVASGDSWGVPEPRADYEVGMVEIAFVGPEGQIDAGSHLWRVVNNGATWHEISVMRTPGYSTPEEALEMLMTVESPDAYPEGVVTVGGVGIVSPGVSVLLEIALEPGQHTAFCFAPDGFVGPPHAVLGMVSSFEVV